MKKFNFKIVLVIVIMFSILLGLTSCNMTMTNGIESASINEYGELIITYTNGKEEPTAFQIEGHKPELMARSAKILEDRATIIDINMGCPIKKIVNGNDGCSLMRNPELAKDIVIAVKESVKIPVTCKFRLGWSNDTKNFVEFAQLMQEAGASAVTVHGRTRSQGYTGEADWDIIKQVKESVSIPVIGNGDIKSGEDAKRRLEETGVDAIMVGRATLGNPWLIKECVEYLEKGINLKDNTIKYKVNTTHPLKPSFKNYLKKCKKVD